MTYFARSLLLIFFLLTGCSDIFSFFKEEGGDEPTVSEEVLPPKTQQALPAERLTALKKLGYFDRAKTENPEDRSVTKTAERAFDGLNLYNSRHEAEALLLDMQGDVLHTWSAETKRPPWMHVALRPNGDLLVISKGNYAAKLDWHSKLLWQRSMGAHHDLTVAPDGRIFVLTHRLNRYEYDGVPLPIMDDHIVVLSPSGDVKERHKLFPLLREFVPTKRLDQLKRRVKAGASTGRLIKEGAPGDTTHTNSIQILSKPIPAIAPAGSILLSVREIDRIVILNAAATQVLWSWGPGELQGQHHATHVENGNITVFDNGVVRKQSRVLEMNPVTGDIAWSYTAPDFFTRLRGAAQKLPNGNVLATESDKGHAFEVTPSGKKVWEFWNPDVRGRSDPTRAVIYRLTRYPFDYVKRELPQSDTPAS